MANEIHVVDPASVAELGEFGASLSTRLADESAANARGALLLNRQARPAWILSGVSIWLELIGAMRDLTPAADAAETGAVLDLEVHNLVSVTGLPAGSPATSASLWVEGWTETIDASSWRIDLAVSDFCRSASPPAWDEIPAAVTWDSIDPTRTWDQAHCMPPSPPAGRWDDIAASLRWDQAGSTTWNEWT